MLREGDGLGMVHSGLETRGLGTTPVRLPGSIYHPPGMGADEELPL